ncbi:MAG: hypothetical protein ACR2MG_04705 [Pyrinomonadaceae bacterium]
MRFDEFQNKRETILQIARRYGATNVCTFKKAIRLNLFMACAL